MNTVFFLAILAYGVWKVFASTTVIGRHVHQPEGDVVFIPNGQEPTNPLVAQAGYLVASARAMRRKWVVLSAYALIALIGAFESFGSAFVGLAVIYGVMVVVDLVTVGRAPRYE